MITTAWICVLSPFVGVLVTPFLARLSPKARDFGAVFFAFVAAFAAAWMLPSLFHEGVLPIEHSINWLSFPVSIDLGLLIDPLSLILTNVVAIISFIIMVYCVGYMKGDPDIARFWMWMNAFIGSMLLLVLANNLLFVFVGWKLVGVCSYGLIGFYYKDEKQYWIGGPKPTPFITPSQAGLKALLVTGIGDMLMLGGLLIVYYFSGTLTISQLYQTVPEWFPQIAEQPGLVALITFLLLAGPIGKSAQFPLHEWLPEAMAGPGPVSALIHAATMVKSGVYLIARFIPIFYYGYWVGGHREAALFFEITAWVGAFTAFLAATQGMVALELKKVLAYSTVSQIGYMMLALGISGLSSDILVNGYSAGIYHLVSHALFKACLFLCAGTVIHSAHSIYMHEMGALRRHMPFTFLFMTIAALSLMGLPPFPGFWSKDAVLIAAWRSNMPLFIFALITVAITAFYTVRCLGMVFFGAESSHLTEQKSKNSHFGEGAPIMWIACGILAVAIVAMGLVGISTEHFIESVFEHDLISLKHLPVEVSHGHGSSHLVPVLSVLGLLIGAIPALMIYIVRKGSPGFFIDRSLIIKGLHQFFWNRWYIDAIYQRLFVRGIFALATIITWFESALDRVIHQWVPRFITVAPYQLLRFIKTDSRELSFNILYVLVLFIITSGIYLFVF